ncbi:MAG: NgoFVII family restriction endonuclease [Oscillospiraceae bacterium]|nr:NgoFVII family restriction endonuclease [Oscillospiraceae bacterium]
MLYYENLEEIIFTRHEIFDSNEFIILSGYIGPAPVAKLESLPMNTTVIYGMYGSDGISESLHNSLKSLQESISNIKILYSTLPIHSKCYMWKKENQIIHALIGSANFSTNGLTTPFREILAETTRDTFSPLYQYINTILDNSIPCEQITLKTTSSKPNEETIVVTDTKSCTMILYDPKKDEVQSGSGLNWGMAQGSHVNQDDASIPIRANHIRNFPTFFPEKLTLPRTNTEKGRTRRHNDAIEMIWDDGFSITGLMEGSYIMGGKVYPKQISSFPAKSILGKYLRNRIGVPSGTRVTMNDLIRYGRTSVDVSLIGEGIYYFDFSNNK